MRRRNDYHDITAILVDGAFYLRRARDLFGEKDAAARADELVQYCKRHLKGTNGKSRNDLYRIFYYDCPPIATNLYHPLTKETINMGKTPHYEWAMEFLEELTNKRKMALRMGELQERESTYRIKRKSLNRLLRGDVDVNALTEDDFELDLVQKGVDMRIGLDIATLAHKDQVSQIVLISGDSDFVPAAKHARREGIDFILDPMWHAIRPELKRHVDGLHSCIPKKPTKNNEPLCVRRDD